MNPQASVDRSQLNAERVEQLGKFSLLTSIFGRRARRFALGMSIPDGPLAFKSRHAAIPLSETETMLLVLAGAGVTGWNFGLPHTTTGAPDTGCNYPMRLIGRTYPSAAGIHASELMWTDDSGTYLTQFRDLNPDQQREFHEAGDLESLIAKARQHIVRISDQRISLPQEFPHIESHNFWVANQPGTTLFIPIVDLTQQVLDGLAILVGERAVPMDKAHNRRAGNLDRFILSGLLLADREIPLADFEQYLLSTVAAEVTLMSHNIVLMLQAMGLGGWFYSGINPGSLLGAFAADGIPGAGFRFTNREDWSGPNPVGLDRYFEGFCPPYHANMREAVQAFVARKFGAGGTYDPATPGPYRRNEDVKRRVHRYPAEFIECLSEIAQYIHDTYGKFPATLPSIYARLYAQAQHIDLDFYDEHFGPEACLHTHREHMQAWHGRE